MSYALLSSLLRWFRRTATGTCRGFLLLGGFSALLMRPERPFAEVEETACVGTAVATQ